MSTVFHRPRSRYDSFTQSFSNYDVIDSRIDVAVQRALIRLRGNPATRGDAGGMLEAVKGARLAGIYGDDLRAAAQLATRLGTVHWELVPRGQIAALIRERDPGRPPTIVFRAQYRGNPEQLDRALVAAWRSFGSTRTGGTVPISTSDRRRIFHPRLGYGWLISKQRPTTVATESYAPVAPAFPRRSSGESEEYGILGPDERQLVGHRSAEVPFRFVCSLDLIYDIPAVPTVEAHFPGSGTLISDLHVLTAAHLLTTVDSVHVQGVPHPVVVSPSVSRVVVMPGRNGVARLGSATMAQPPRVCPHYQPHSSEPHPSSGYEGLFDYGLITLSVPIGATQQPARRVGRFGFTGVPFALGNPFGFWSSPLLGGGTRIMDVRADALPGARVYTSGYPGDKCLNSPLVGSATPAQLAVCDNAASTQWRAQGSIINSSLDPGQRLLSHDMDIARGQSGSPIWLNSRGSRFLVGVVSSIEVFSTRVENVGVRITREVLDQLREWMGRDGVTATF